LTKDSESKTAFVDDEKYDLGFSQLSDEAFLKEELADLETRKWYPPSTDSDVNIFARNWAGFARYKCSLTATYNGEKIGMATIFLMPYVKVAHLAMMYVIVKKEYRNKGVGRSLIRNINHLAKTKFRLESMHIEMFEGCPIEPVLIGTGYKQVVFQENFVEFDEGMKGRKIYEVDLGD
jgi:hypothetical protein